MEEKSEVRKHINFLIRGLSDEYKFRSDWIIVERVKSSEEYKSAKTVFAFAGMAEEIDTTPLLESIIADGKRLALPRCMPNGQMDARLVSSLKELKLSKMGIREPGEDAPVIGPEEIDLAIIPALSCTLRGERLGRGGGYYDRYFADHQDIPSMILCRSRLVSSSLPVEPHDVRFRKVVTEDGIYGK